MSSPSPTQFGELVDRLEAPATVVLYAWLVSAAARLITVAVGSPPMLHRLAVWAYLGLSFTLLLVLLPGLLIGASRIWAISSVSFQESIRRRILWITPLMILGVVIVSQLQKPFDEQDAIRQTIKYCLFATGTLVVLTGVILAASNLPKEIETRVIYTLVTKPVTRLEIVLGKVVGFARVSATILLIMGLFTYAYVQLRSRALISEVKQRLTLLSPTDASRPTLEHYASYGLLHAKTYARPSELHQFGIIPPSDNTPDSANLLRWINGGDEQSIIVPFDLPVEALALPDEPADLTALEVQLNIPFRPKPSTAAGMARLAGAKETAAWHPTPFPGQPPRHASFAPFVLERTVVVLQFLDADRFTLFSSNELPRNGYADLYDNALQEPVTVMVIPTHPFDLLHQQPENPPGKHRIWLQMSGTDAHNQYGAARGSVRLRSRRVAMGNQTGEIKLSPMIDPAPGPDGQPATPVFRGRSFLGAQQLRGVANPVFAPVAVFKVRESTEEVQPDADGQVPIELRFPIEGTGDESMTGKEAVATASLEVFNLTTGRTSPAAIFPIESNRTIFVNVPGESMKGGNYDIRLRCLAAGNTLALRPTAVAVVASEQSFLINLLKSLLVLWLMALLVVTAAIFCSTFVSWPIAVVLTVLILLGRWGIDQVGESGPGVGNQITRDLFPGSAPPVAKAISSSVEGLSSALNHVARVLPDISAFSATEEIERGVNMPGRVLRDSWKVILKFAVPMTLLAYVILKKKEVAP